MNGHRLTAAQIRAYRAIWQELGLGMKPGGPQSLLDYVALLEELEAMSPLRRWLAFGKRRRVRHLEAVVRSALVFRGPR